MTAPAAVQALLGDWPDPAASWRDDALCAQVDVGDLFFPEKGGSTQAAKLVCQLCDVRQQCLDFALDTDERHGIWGGLSDRERRVLRRRRLRGAA